MITSLIPSNSFSKRKDYNSDRTIVFRHHHAGPHLVEEGRGSWMPARAHAAHFDSCPSTYAKPPSNHRSKKRRRRLFFLSLIIVAFLAYNGGLDEIQDIFLNKLGRRQLEVVWNVRSLLRDLSLYLGNGRCKWQPPIYDVPENITFTKTLIAGYPSGDKRLTFVQMEALTGLSARDEWDFAFLGPTNQPFIKANYPHHEGIWGWGDRADQVIMIVRNMRRTMVEYHDILWDIGYAETYEEARANFDRLYAERPPLEDFLVWRDIRVMDEVHWYGWFIDYYMEGGLMRDMFTHKITTPEHWYMLMQPTRYTKYDMTYDKIVGSDTIVTPSYDPHCINDVSGGCEPLDIISAEKLVELSTGPTEGRKIAKALENRTGIQDWLIEEDAWECIWTELIVNKKGIKTFIDRDGIEERDYNFSEEMLREMIIELNRLVDKYSGDDWNTLKTAQYLVQLLKEHLVLIKAELVEVLSGDRRLREHDFLGPETRKQLFPSTASEESIVRLLRNRNNETNKHT